MMEDKIDKLAEAINEVNITMARQEVHLKNNTDHLDRLTSSVEEHVKRSDNTDKAVALLQANLENKKDNDKLVLTVLAAVGAVLLALKELGILDKLF